MLGFFISIIVKDKLKELLIFFKANSYLAKNLVKELLGFFLRCIYILKSFCQDK